MQASMTMETTPSTADPRELVRQAAAGDSGAFEALYHDNIGRIYALCLRMSADPSLAEELAQEAFIRAWEKLHTFRGAASFSTWLHRVAANIVLSRRRSDARRTSRVVEQEDMSYHQETTDRTNRGPKVDLEEAIATLPEGARQIFVLFDIEGYRHDEIAEIAGIATGTSKAQLHRARKLLREALSR